ncbi:MAG: right-handed parallel beta-helix repeat-containing protein, partial [Bacteroidales bacterium]|nr:right-handed parallel beta-helix repeat-containing protein [Bacteroidales bacterium]
MRRVFILFFWVLSSVVSASTYYVSTEGNDGSDGLTIPTAWKTISKVNSAFSSMKPGDRVLFRRGDTFYGTLTITASGIAGNNIVISAFGTGANPVISGFSTLSSWTNEGSGIYSKAVACESFPNLVTLNGSPVATGRWPNAGCMIFESHSGTSSITDIQLTDTPNWTNAELVIRSSDYSLDRVKITNHSNSTISFTTGSVSKEPKNGYGYWIQNDIKTLDQMGEWYYDGTKLYMFFGTNNPDNYEVRIATLNLLANIKASRFITIDNISFSGTNVAAIIYEGYNVNNIIIQNCDIKNSGNYGIRFADPIYAGDHLTINNCTIENCMSAGINISGVFTYNTITNNKLQNIGYIEGMGANYCGITVFGDNTVVEYNTINNIGYNGIYPLSNNLSVRNNVISNFCTVIDDGGGIYMGDWVDKQNKVISGNIIFRGIGAPNGGGSANPRLVRGIYIDTSSGTSGSKDIQVTNNTVFDCAYDGIYVTDGNNNVNVENNTAFNNKVQFQIRDDNSSYSEKNITVLNNIFYSKSSDQISYRFQTISNLTFSAFGTSDNNFITRPVDDDEVFHTYTPSTGTKLRTLEVWRTLTSQDLNSKRSPVTIKDTAAIDFYYNTTKTDRVITLVQPMLDVKGTSYINTVTLTPFTSIILMVDPDPPVPVVPVYVSSVIDNLSPTKLEISYTVPLDENSIPLTSDFIVKVNGASRTITKVEIIGSKVVLTLASPVIFGDNVTLTYTQNPGSPLQTPSFGMAANLTNMLVVNNLADPSVVNDPPFVVINYTENIFSGFVYEIDASGTTDAENDELTFTWTAPENIPVSALTGSRISYLSPIVTNSQEIIFGLSVSDGNQTVTRSLSVNNLPYKPELGLGKAEIIEASNYYLTNYPGNVDDGNLSTLWSVEGDNQ